VHEGSGPADTSEAALTYGTGPVRDPSITYQPDVVIVEGGPRAIRSASSDGLIWTIDGKARGAQDVRPGKVLYATSRAVGRVQEVRRVHGDVVATLGPVEFTEVFRDAHLNLDQDIDDGALHYLEIPDLPGAVTVPADAPTDVATGAEKGAAKDAAQDVPTTARTIGQTSVRAAHSGRVGTVVARGAVRLAAAAGGTLPPARSSSVTADLGEWKAQPYRSPGAFRLKFNHKAAAGLKVFVDFSLKTEKLHIRSDVPISGGRVADGATFAVEGIKSVAISIAAGAANGVIDNSKIRAEVPVQMTLPIAGTPFAFNISWKFSVATALGGNNTTVTAGGEWGSTVPSAWSTARSSGTVRRSTSTSNATSDTRSGRWPVSATRRTPRTRRSSSAGPTGGCRSAWCASTTRRRTAHHWRSWPEGWPPGFDP
jgi:hypothetical protein